MTTKLKPSLVIVVAEFESYSQLTFYISSTSTLAQSLFRPRPFISHQTNVLNLICELIIGCVAEFANIYGVHFWAKVFRPHIESWPEWDSNLKPRTYHTHALTTDLSGQLMRCSQWFTGSSDQEAQIDARWLQWPSSNHIRS